MLRLFQRHFFIQVGVRGGDGGGVNNVEEGGHVMRV
jgi:hypothetical protein